ncbi:MAG: ECF-type sigma factor [Pseudomonadota bacterium]
MTDSNALTAILQAASAGDAAAQAELLPRVYDELHRVAAGYMRRERAGHTLQATALVNEAYLKLVNAQVTPKDRQHFFATAAQMMRRVLVDHARGRNREKRGGDQLQVTFNEADLRDERSADVLDLDDALTKLAAFDERSARAIELMYFAGLSYEETAAALGTSKTTVFEDLKLARAWLAQEMGD